MSAEAHDVQKEVRTYMMVFAGLLFLTLVTVGVSYLQLSLAGAVALALFIATIKASLVACYFMHLISEKKFIYILLIFTAIFFLVLMALPIGNYHDDIIGTTHVS